jgi:LPS-assembly protein
VEYRNRREEATTDAVDYGSVNLSLAWLKPIYLGYRSRYDFVTAEPLEQVLELEYRHQCWSILLKLREREDDQSVMVTFSLGGIGQVGASGASMGGS